MKTFTNDDIRMWGPCYDPSEKYPNEETVHTVITILDDEHLTPSDKLWVVMRTDLVSEKLMRLFAVYCARSCVTADTDKRSLAAIDVAERFANGLATIEELSAARSAAESAAQYAAQYAAQCAAQYAAESAARYASRYAARYASRYAAELAQITHLRKMIIDGVETGDVMT